jgi:hypothetical protein
MINFKCNNHCPIAVWFGVRFTPGGHSTFFGFLNTFVHIVMYTYYLFSAMGPEYYKYLWWKKYLTTLQMAQFILIMLHAFQLLFIDCNYPKAFVWWIGMHAIMFFFLFKEFYKQSYRASKVSYLQCQLSCWTNSKILILFQPSKSEKNERKINSSKKQEQIREIINTKNSRYSVSTSN